MHMRKGAGAALAVVGLTALVAASPASAQGAKKLEPLNQYVVSGRINPEDLARAGYDLTEGGLKGHKSGWVITATAKQADSLEAKGATVRPLGRERTAAVAAPSPLTPPTHGYNVFRPWSLTPAPCPQTCATPNIPLKQWYADLAAHNTDVVKAYVIGKSVLGQDIVACHQERAPREGRQPSGSRLQRHPARARVDLRRGRAPALQVRPRQQGPDHRQQGQGPPCQERAVVRADRQP